MAEGCFSKDYDRLNFPKVVTLWPKWNLPLIDTSSSVRTYKERVTINGDLS